MSVIFLRARFMQRFTELRMARREGFEPPTPRFEVWCSIQLSYRRLVTLRMILSENRFPLFGIMRLRRGVERRARFVHPGI